MAPLALLWFTKVIELCSLLNYTPCSHTFTFLFVVTMLHETQGWKNKYEPSEEEAPPSEPNIMQKKIVGMITENLRDNIMWMLTEATAKLLGPTEDALESDDGDLAEFVNACNGVVLSYRFQYLNKDQFSYIRLVGVDRIAAALVADINKQALKHGHQPGDDIPPEVVDAIAEDIAQKVQTHIEGQQEKAVESLKESPVFHIAGVEDNQIDEGVQKLLEFLRHYVESKMGLMIFVIKVTVAKLLAVAMKNRKVIAKHVEELRKREEDKIAKEKERKESGEQVVPEVEEEVVDEAYTAARNELLSEVESAYDELETSVHNYVGTLMHVMTGIPPSGVAIDSEEGDADALKNEAGATDEAVSSGDSPLPVAEKEK